MTGLAPVVRWLPGTPARICPGRLRGMDLSVRRHAVHGATVSNGVSNGFAGRGCGLRLIMRSDQVHVATTKAGLPAVQGMPSRGADGFVAGDKVQVAVSVSRSFGWPVPASDAATLVPDAAWSSSTAQSARARKYRATIPA